MKKTIRLTESDLSDYFTPDIDNIIYTNGDTASIQEIPSRLDNGENPENIFDGRRTEHGFTKVFLRDKGFNVIDNNGQLLFTKGWLDWIGPISEEGIAIIPIRFGGKSYNNYINLHNCETLFANSNRVHCLDFKNGLGWVQRKDGKWNCVNANGCHLLDNWCDRRQELDNGYTVVTHIKKNKYYYYPIFNFIDKNGRQ